MALCFFCDMRARSMRWVALVALSVVAVSVLAERTEAGESDAVLLRQNGTPHIRREKVRIALRQKKSTTEKRRLVKGASKTTDDHALAIVTRIWNSLSRLEPSPEKRYVLIMQGNNAMVPMLWNWLCNTKHMAGVHERTVLIMSDRQGFDALQYNPYKVAVAKTHQMVDEMDEDFNFGTYGYWKLTQLRTKTFEDILASGISFLNWEPDALWARNPMEDAGLLEASRQADIAILSDEHVDGSLILGVGFMLVRSNAGTVALFQKLMDTLSQNLRKLGPHNLHDNVGYPKTISEQTILKELLLSVFAGATYAALDRCTYTSGQWYTFNNIDLRRRCVTASGAPVVVNNNWIVGNAAKIKRAQLWGHWFIDETGACNVSQVAVALTEGLLWPAGASKT